MVDLPERKVGIVCCSGEEIAEGTVTRLAALKVLEELRPGRTVRICLPLFLAGGEGDRAFARLHPTVVIDGCEKRCAARATEMYSGKPAESLVITEMVCEKQLDKPAGRRRLNEAGAKAVEAAAQQIAGFVDQLIGRGTKRPSAPQEPVQAACSCGSKIPIQEVDINGRPVSLLALPIVFQQFREAGKTASDATARELLETVKIYNSVPEEQEPAYVSALGREYIVYCKKQEGRG